MLCPEYANDSTEQRDMSYCVSQISITLDPLLQQHHILFYEVWQTLPSSSMGYSREMPVQALWFKFPGREHNYKLALGRSRFSAMPHTFMQPYSLAHIKKKENIHIAVDCSPIKMAPWYSVLFSAQQPHSEEKGGTLILTVRKTGGERMTEEGWERKR